MYRQYILVGETSGKRKN